MISGVWETRDGILYDAALRDHWWLVAAATRVRQLAAR